MAGSGNANFEKGITWTIDTRISSPSAVEIQND